MTEDSDVPDRERLLRFARTMGAGFDSESVVQEAMQAAGGPDRPDPQQLWSSLASLLAERVADRYRQVARAQILARHRASALHPSPLAPDLAARTEAPWTAQQLVALLPRDILDLLWSHHVGGATWTELATDRRVSPDTLQRRVHQALHTARRRTAGRDGDPNAQLQLWLHDGV